MSEEQGYIMERDHDTSEKDHGEGHFGGSEIFGNDRNRAGDADAEGGYNKGDVDINIEQGGDAYARGGDVTTYEEHHVYKEYTKYNEHDEHGGCREHDEHDEHDTKEYSEYTGPDVVF